jgi:hypothetical protein
MLTIGNEIFADSSDIQKRLLNAIGDQELIMSAFSQSRSQYDDITDMAYMLIGYYLNHGFNVSAILADPANF